MTKTRTNYIVTVTVRYPAYDEREGIRFYVQASSKADAIAEARRQNRRGGQVHSQNGPATWRAEVRGDTQAFIIDGIKTGA